MTKPTTTEAQAIANISNGQVGGRPAKLRRVRVCRLYQLGGASYFNAASRADMLRIAKKDRLSQVETGDLQGISYHVHSTEDAARLGCYETKHGEWVIDGTEQVIEISPGTV